MFSYKKFSILLPRNPWPFGIRVYTTGSKIQGSPHPTASRRQQTPPTGIDLQTLQWCRAEIPSGGAVRLFREMPARRQFNDDIDIFRWSDFRRQAIGI